jgi:hypothetical protein
MNSPKLIAILFLITSCLDATEKPTIPEMAGRSDIIVVGRVVKVDNPGEPFRKITIQVKEIIKGHRTVHGLKTITFPYVRMGKGNIDFQKAKQENTDKIFFLRFIHNSPETVRLDTPAPTSFQLEMADAWFGMGTGEKRIKAELNELERKAKRLYREH